MQSRTSLRHRSPREGWERCGLGQELVQKKVWSCLCRPTALLYSRTGHHGAAAQRLMGSRTQFPLGCINPERSPTLSRLHGWLGNRQGGSHLPASTLLCYKSPSSPGEGAVEAFLETLAWFSDLWLPEEGYSTLLLMIGPSSRSQVQNNFNLPTFFKVLFETRHNLCILPPAEATV